MAFVQLVPLICIIIISAFSVLHHCFDDNLLQRIGLSGICIGAACKAAIIVMGTMPADQSLTILTYGLAAFGIGSFLKNKGCSPWNGKL